MTGNMIFKSVLIISLYTSIGSFAQSYDALDYLVLKTGDTLYGKIEYKKDTGVNYKYLNKIRLTNALGKQKRYKRDQVVAFSTNNFIYEGFWLNQESESLVLLNPRYEIDDKNGGYYFLKVMSKGTLSYYQLEWWEQGESLLMSMDLLKKEKDQFFIRATQGLFGLKRKVLSSYFNGCPSLAQKIQQKQLNQVFQVVDYYNNNCVK
ncbi:hypothetical protein FJ651_12890 [Paucihalobacter ruber]|uniref:Uncharacterized protein n=1 Tax=Paucihalobacter ruber TaxID=2567861 RepID=A0A506PH82_9FLAO|nr:hypothetical protein [Paucihalobacter ruber]TPV32452.1 hypothetical protein FJ651_12890 [Paucihalobacter ruber]